MTLNFKSLLDKFKHKQFIADMGNQCCIQGPYFCVILNTSLLPYALRYVLFAFLTAEREKMNIPCRNLNSGVDERLQTGAQE